VQPAEPSDQRCIDAVSFCSQQLTLGKALDATRIDKAYAVTSFVQRDRKLLAPPARRLETCMDTLNLTILQPGL
jgi:hypothetical protein